MSVTLCTLSTVNIHQVHLYSDEDNDNINDMKHYTDIYPVANTDVVLTCHGLKSKDGTHTAADFAPFRNHCAVFLATKPSEILEKDFRTPSSRIGDTLPAQPLHIDINTTPRLGVHVLGCFGRMASGGYCVIKALRQSLDERTERINQGA
jgi:hypothetical protein